MVKWKNGTLVSPAHVNEDGTITPAVYEGETPLSAYNLNLMQNEIISVLQQIETPNPVTGENITLNDCKAGKFKSFEIEGNSVQNGELSPEFEAPIRSCGDNIQILKGTDTVTTLSDGTWENGTWRSAASGTGTRESIKIVDSHNGTIKNGWRMTSTDGEVSIAQNAVPMIAGKKYTMSCYARGSGKLRFSGGITNNFNINTTIFEKYVFTFNSIGSANVFFGVYDAGNVEFYDMKLEKGDIASDWSKYGEGSINITTSNQNMFYSEMFNDNSTNLGITLKTMPGTNNIVLNGTATGKFTILSKPLPINMFKIGQKYTISKNYSEHAFFSIAENGSNEDSVWGSSFVMNKNYTRIRVYVQCRTGQTPTFNNQVVSLQIEEGDATTIIEHEGQAYTIPVQKPFRNVEDIRDHFIKKGGKYYEEHLVERYIFKGTETITTDNNGKRIYLKFSTNNLSNLPKVFAKTTAKYGLLCNYLNEVSATDTWNGVEGVSYCAVSTLNSSLSGFFVSINEFTTVDEYKNWFAQKYAAGNPFYVDYILAEPELIECTAAQTAVLQDIKDNLETYDDCTHIYSTDVVAPNFEVTYCKDIEKLFNNIAI